MTTYNASGCRASVVSLYPTNVALPARLARLAKAWEGRIHTFAHKSKRVVAQAAQVARWLSSLCARARV